MSSRPFAVFQDTPVEDSTQKPSTASAAAENPLSPKTSFQDIVRSTETVLSPTMEKENLNPITGLAVQPSSMGKKRKMSESGSVLATKAIAPPSSSSSKSRELKRRSSSASAAGKSKGKTGLSRKGSEGRTVLGSSENASSGSTAGSRRASRALSRQPTSLLGSVPEETHDSIDEASSVQQALIDARCYDLTVKPLADVSVAYLQSSKEPETKDEDLLEIRMVKEKADFGSQLRDYFTATGALSISSFSSTSSASISSASSKGRDADFTDEEDPASLPSSPKKARKSYDDGRSRSPSPTPNVLSTPERKELYASFTFITPASSPTKSK